MKQILSIQSHVAYGYVGNRVATFVLQRLGHDVMTINTVQFSNHTGYGQWQGDVFTQAHVESVLQGLHERGVMSGLDAMLTGYIGSADLGQVVLSEVNHCRRHNPNFLYCCDPVLGDVGRDLFVPEPVAAFFRDAAVQSADVMTPNLFELAYLTKRPLSSIQTEADLRKAIVALQAKGPRIVLVTSVMLESTPEDCIDVVFAEGEKMHRIRTPKLSVEIPPNGAGDAVSALLLGHYLLSEDWLDAFEQTVAGVFAILQATADAGTRELQLIAAQEDFVAPAQYFTVTPL